MIGKMAGCFALFRHLIRGSELLLRVGGLNRSRGRVDDLRVPDRQARLPVQLPLRRRQRPDPGPAGRGRLPPGQFLVTSLGVRVAKAVHLGEAGP